MSPKAASQESASPLGCRPIAQARPPRQHAYDAAGNRTGVIDARGNRITFTYDSRGAQIELVDQLARRTTFGYDELRRQSWRWDPEDQRSKPGPRGPRRRN